MTERTIAFDADGRLAESVACRGCGYDLHGLARTARCPECAMIVDRSVRGDLLRFSEPAWLRGMARGARWTAWGSIAAVVVTILFSAGAILLGAAGRTDLLGYVTAVVGVGFTLVALVIALAVWMLTVPEAARLETEHPLSVRRLARIGVLAFVVSAPMQIVLGGPPGTAPPPTGLVSSVLTILGVLMMLASFVSLAGWVGLLLYMRNLALRGDAPGLRRQANIVKWGYAIFGTMSVASMFLMMFIAPTFMTQSAAPAGLTGRVAILFIVTAGVGCVGTALHLAFEVWFIAILVQFARLLDGHAVHADVLWAADQLGESAGRGSPDST